MTKKDRKKNDMSSAMKFGIFIVVIHWLIVLVLVLKEVGWLKCLGL